MERRNRLLGCCIAETAVVARCLVISVSTRKRLEKADYNYLQDIRSALSVEIASVKRREEKAVEKTPTSLQAKKLRFYSGFR